MTHEKMTVHKALAELKVIDARIEGTINKADFVVANKHSNEKIAGVPVTEFKQLMRANYQKATDLINRRNAMKRAVVLSNAKTVVEIGSESYTVAEAIEMKNHGMEHMRTLLRELTRQYTSAQGVLLMNSGEALEKKAENYVLSVIQAQPKDSKMSVDSDAMKALRKTYLENNAYDLVDPIDTKKVMEDLSEQITKFETEIDAALSVSNALTIIEFDY